MLAFSICVAGSFSLGALAANEIAPVAMNAARFWLAAAMIGGAGLIMRGVPASSFRAPWRYLLLGGFFGCYFVTMFEALKTASPVNTSALFTLVPVMSAGFGWLLLRQRLTRRMTLALTIGAFGAVWVIFRADLGAVVRLEIGRGEQIFFLGSISYALYAPLSRRLHRGEATLAYTFWTMVFAAALVTLWGWEAVLATDWMQLPPIVWITLGYIVVFASAATLVLINLAIQRLPTAKVMAYTYLVPSWVILWELALGAQTPPILVSAGFAMTLVALGLLLRDDTPAPSPVPAG
jgi:drug/metabolite transporter (DMT)-like permease